MSLRCSPLRWMLLDLLADLAGFLLAVPDGHDADLVAVFADVGLEGLAEAALVVGDEVGGGAEDVGGRAVVALERMTLAPGKSFSKRRMLSTSAPRQP